MVTSTIEAERHLKHGNIRMEVTKNSNNFISEHGFTGRNANAPAGYRCNFVAEDQTLCNQLFDTRSQHDRHKNSEGHIRKTREQDQ